MVFGRKKKQQATDVQERTSGGQPVYRHQPGDATVSGVAPPDVAVRTAVGEHIERYLGPSSSTFGEIVSDKVELNVVIWDPTPDRPMYTLITQGMSDLPMNMPSELVADGAAQRAELMVCLPPDWTMPNESNPRAWQDESAYFPVRYLKMLARLPFDYDTWLGVGHTIPNGDPPEPMSDDTKLCGWLLMNPVTLSDDFASVSVDRGRDVSILAMVALYSDELQQKLDRGAESLVDRFEQLAVSELLDLDRPSAAS